MPHAFVVRIGLVPAVAGLSAASAVSVSAGPNPPSIVWLATGDSFSSGTGVEDREDGCRRAEDAYAPRVRRRLDAQGWDVRGWAFTACDGATISRRTAEFEDPPEHWRVDFNDTVIRGQQLLLDQVGPILSAPGSDPPVKVDLMTFTFGGNDIGFDEIIKSCIGVTVDVRRWRDPRCPYTEKELNQRVDALEDGDNLTRRGRGIRVWEEDPWPGSLAFFYREVHQRHVARGGTLIVIGYPRLFAPSQNWTGISTGRCERIRRPDADMLGRVAARLDDVIDRQVDLAAGPRHDIRYISVLDAYRSGIPSYSDGGHELCGSGTTWLNGLIGFRNPRAPTRPETPSKFADPPAHSETTPERISVLDVSDSFHPNSGGHAAVAELLYRELRSLEVETPPPEADAPEPAPSDPSEGSNGAPADPADAPESPVDDQLGSGPAEPTTQDPSTEASAPDEPDGGPHSEVAAIDVRAGVAIEAGAGALWVADLGGWDAAVHKVNVDTNRVGRTLAVDFPSSIAVGLGSVWVASSPHFDTLLLRVDPDTARITGEVRVDAFGPHLAIGAGSVWVSDASGRRVLRIDPARLEVTATISVGSTSAITFGDGALWVANGQDVTVSRIDPATNTVRHTIDLDVGPRGCCTSAHGITYGAGAVWVGVTDDPGNGSVVRIDPATRRQVARVEIGRASMDYHNDMLAASSSAVWATNGHHGTVSRIDPATNRVTATVSVRGEPQAIEVTNNAVWIGQGDRLARVEPP